MEGFTFTGTCPVRQTSHFTCRLFCSGDKSRQSGYLKKRVFRVAAILRFSIANYV